TTAQPPQAAPVHKELPHRARPVRGAKPQPQQPVRVQRTLPWRRDGSSRVVFVHTKQVAVYRSPRAKRALLVLKKRDRNGTRRAFLVRGTGKDWVHVYLPTRPNG